MAEVDWHKCRFLESVENLKPLVKRRFGREPSTSVAQEITACLQQGRLFYEAAAASPLEIRPLQLFYGMVGFAKALVVAHRLRRLSTLQHAHGISDISTGNSRIADLRVRIGSGGTFQEFNDVVAALTRVVYIDSSTTNRAVALPSDVSATLTGIDLSFQEVLSRIPGLGALFELTFGQEAKTEAMLLETGFHGDGHFLIRIDDPELFGDRESLKRIVGRWRATFPFLRSWRLSSAQHGWGNSIIEFMNVHVAGLDEFSESNLVGRGGSFQSVDALALNEARFTLAEGLDSVAGGFSGGASFYAISPIKDLCLSEFSLQYLALFQLSSLVRYRPQTWTRAISHSASSSEPADDRSLSLIERFLDLNSGSIPDFAVKVLNPNEDRYSGVE